MIYLLMIYFNNDLFVNDLFCQWFTLTMIYFVNDLL